MEIVAEKVTATEEEAGEALAAQLLVAGGKFRQPAVCLHLRRWRCTWQFVASLYLGSFPVG
jgi:hypothetical protein